MATVNIMKGANAKDNARAQLNIIPLPEFSATPSHLLLLRRSLLVSSFDRLAIEDDPAERTALADISRGGTEVDWTPDAAMGATRGQQLFAPHIALPYDTGFTIAFAIRIAGFEGVAMDTYVCVSDDWAATTPRQGVMVRVREASGNRNLQLEIATPLGRETASVGAGTNPNPVSRIYMIRWDPLSEDQITVYSYATGNYGKKAADGVEDEPDPNAGIRLLGRTGTADLPHEIGLHMYCQWDEPLSDSSIEAEAARLDAWLALHGVDIEVL